MLEAGGEPSYSGMVSAGGRVGAGPLPPPPSTTHCAWWGPEAQAPCLGEGLFSCTYLPNTSWFPGTHGPGFRRPTR